jgi:hypothetical protein
VSRLELERPRDIPTLFRDALVVYGTNLPAFLGISAAIVVPVQLIVSGIGLEQLTASYDKSPPPVEAIVPTAVSFLIIAPLVTAACIHALRAVAQAGSPRAGTALVEGLEAFRPLFFAILLEAGGIAIGLAALVLPGVYLTVRWFFVPQAVVLEGKRGVQALRRSGEMVGGLWWRTFGIVILANLAATLPGFFLTAPFAALAEHAGREVYALAGSMAAEVVTAPFVALLSTLLYYDLRARRKAPAV